MIKKILIAIFLIIAIGAGLYFIYGNKPAPESFLKVSRKDITEEVAVTGQLTAKESLALSFELGGKVAAVYVDAGQKVSAGEPLIALDTTEVDAQIAQADASLRAARANLAQAGAALRNERRTWRDFDETSASISLDNAFNSSRDVLTDAYQKAYAAVYTATDELFTGPSYDPFGYEPISFSVNNSSLVSRVQEDRRRAKTSLDRMERDLHSLPASRAALTRRISANISYMRDAQLFLEDLAALLEYSTSLSSTVLASYKISIVNARASVTAGTSALHAHSQNLDLQQSATGEKGDIQELALRQAETGVQTNAAQLDRANQDLIIAQSRSMKTLLRSPGTFVVTKVGRRQNELAQAYAPVVYLMSPGEFEVEANVPEADISAISVGNAVSLTFDALGEKIFTGSVAKFEPAETIIDGVVSYKVTVALENAVDDRLRSGFTTNVRIKTRVREKVLVVPAVALIENDAGTFVKVRRDGKVEEAPVKTGVTDQTGMVEIISGVREGEEVLNVGIITNGNTA